MTLRSSSFLLFLFALMIALCLTPSASAQAISGDLVGSVVDASGAALPNVTVTATNTATNIRFTGTSNTAGDYRISNLPPGTYDVTAGTKGFATQNLHGVS